jgi:hypothetical protein
MLSLKWPLGSDPQLDIPPVPHPDVDLDLDIPPRPTAKTAAPAVISVIEPNRPVEPVSAPFAPTGEGIDDLDIPAPQSWLPEEQPMRDDGFGIPSPSDVSPLDQAPSPVEAALEDDAFDSTRVIEPAPEEDLRTRRSSQSEPLTRPRPAWKDPDYVPDWGMTQDRKDPEYVIPQSEDRPKRDYVIPISEDRAEPEVTFTPIERRAPRGVSRGPLGDDFSAEKDGIFFAPAPLEAIEPDEPDLRFLDALEPTEKPGSGSAPSQPRRPWNDPDYVPDWGASEERKSPELRIVPLEPRSERAAPGGRAGTAFDDGNSSEPDRFRPDDASAPAGSNDREAREPGAAGSARQAHAPTAAGSARPRPAWKDPDYVPDWGSSEERKDPEYFFTPTQERPEREYQVPISHDRIEKERAVPLSRDREMRDDDILVPISHDRIEKERAVPLSRDRVEKNYFAPFSPNSEDMREREAASSKADRKGKKPDTDPATQIVSPIGPKYETDDGEEYDPAYLSEISDTLAAMEFGSEIAASLAQLVQEASADEKHGLEDIRIRFAAWYDTQSEAISLYITDPCVRELDGSESPYHSVLSAGPSPERCLALDCQMLERLKAELPPLRGQGARFILGLPVAASTLLRPKFRSQYLQLWTDIDDDTRQMIRLTAYNLPETAASQASDLFGWMRSLGRQPIVRIPPRAELIAPLGGFGIYAVAINYQKWFTQLGPQLFVETLLRILKQCRQHRVRLALIKLPDRRAIQIGLAAGVDYLEIGTVERTEDLPRQPLRITKAQSIQRFGNSFVNGAG